MKRVNMEPIQTNKTEIESKQVKPLGFNEKTASVPQDKKSEPAKTGTSPVYNESIDSKQLEDIAKSLNAFLNSTRTGLEVEIHKDTKTAIFKIIRKEDNKVIKEIPPKEVLELAARIKGLVGSLHDSNA
jgi:flagellar protein FlaG